MEAWKNGKKPEDLKDGNPSIVVSDADWQAGRKLVSYKVGAERDGGYNLHCTVDLVTTDDKGAEQPLQVTYVIGTSPVITIFRDNEI
jgi:hypothetical protein